MQSSTRTLSISITKSITTSISKKLLCSFSFFTVIFGVNASNDSSIISQLDRQQNITTSSQQNRLQEVNSLDAFVTSNNLLRLRQGDILSHAVILKAGTALNDLEKQVINTISGLSFFQNQNQENGIATLDLNDYATLKRHSFVVNKSMFFVPNKQPSSLAKINAQLLASERYHRECEPGIESGKTKLDFPNVGHHQDNSFRVKKIVGPKEITIQMLTSEIYNKELIKNLSRIDGINYDKAILMERTRNDILISDNFKLVKNLLLYRQSSEGILVTSYTVVATEMGMVARCLIAGVKRCVNIDSFSTEDSTETAVRTRNFMLNKL
ncbi:MAG: hypothetical protein HQK53_10990 [Oligoflexia bacterium]|nr:hypothetical protein [Oligoflexia bacterium]